MPGDNRDSSRPQLPPTAKMSFAVSAAAFAAAITGLFVNQWLSGWMAVGGMAGIGLFYLAIGVLNLSSTASLFDEEEEEISVRVTRLRPGVSDAANLTGEQVSRSSHESSLHQRREDLASTRE